MHLANFRKTVMSCLTFQHLLLSALLPPLPPVNLPYPLQMQPIYENLILRFVQLIPCTHTAQCGVIIGTPLIYVSSYSPLNG